jgi:hypothetical protein
MPAACGAALRPDARFRRQSRGQPRRRPRRNHPRAFDGRAVEERAKAARRRGIKTVSVRPRLFPTAPSPPMSAGLFAPRGEWPPARNNPGLSGCPAPARPPSRGPPSGTAKPDWSPSSSSPSGPLGTLAAQRLSAGAGFDRVKLSYRPSPLDVRRSPQGGGRCASGCGGLAKPLSNSAARAGLAAQAAEGSLSCPRPRC